MFVLIMDELLKDTMGEIPWCMLFADDIRLVAETVEEVTEMLGKVANALESKGLKVNREKTEYMKCCWDGVEKVEEVAIEGKYLKKVEEYKYLGSWMNSAGSLESDLTSRINVGWHKWREVKGVLCDKKVSECGC